MLLTFSDCFSFLKKAAIQFGPLTCQGANQLTPESTCSELVEEATRPLITGLENLNVTLLTSIDTKANDFEYQLTNLTAKFDRRFTMGKYCIYKLVKQVLVPKVFYC